MKRMRQSILKDHKSSRCRQVLMKQQAREVLRSRTMKKEEASWMRSPIHVAIAGRMMFKRVMGKASFCNIQDLQGNIQVYVARDAIGDRILCRFQEI